MNKGILNAMTNSDRIEQARYLYQMIPAFDSEKINYYLPFSEIKSYIHQIAAVALQGC
jgi:hypothetical protein